MTNEQYDNITSQIFHLRKHPNQTIFLIMLIMI